MSLKTLPFLMIFPIVLLLYPGYSGFYRESGLDIPAVLPRFATAADSLRFLDEAQRRLPHRSDGTWQLPHAALVEAGPVRVRDGQRDLLLDPGGRFLALPGFRVRSGYRFSIDGGRQLLRQPETFEKNGEAWLSFREQEVPVRFAVTDEGAGLGRLLLPAEESSGRLVFALVLMALAFFFPLAMFLHPCYTLLQILKGSYFNRSHVRMLRLMGIALVLVAVLPVLCTALLRWVYADLIPAPIDYAFGAALWREKHMIVAGLVVLILARAFQRGQELEEYKESIV